MYRWRTRVVRHLASTKLQAIKKLDARADIQLFMLAEQARMVGRVGFEPTTNWLKANCSTN